MKLRLIEQACSCSTVQVGGGRKVNARLARIQVYLLKGTNQTQKNDVGGGFTKPAPSFTEPAPTLAATAATDVASGKGRLRAFFGGHLLQRASGWWFKSKNYVSPS